MTIKSVCVLGLGYIGLPTASTLATNGFTVVGVDTNESIVGAIDLGLIHIEEPGLNTMVKAAVKSGQLMVKSKPEEADAFIIAVPTPLTAEKKADLQYVIAAAESIRPYLRKGNLVILESTSPPRTTVDILVPILTDSGLEIGEELFVAYCPERVLPGNIMHELVNNNRIIGGINEKSSLKARELYQKFVQGSIILTDATSAEMVKLMENTYRDVNIALSNELALISAALNLDALEIIRLANMHPRVKLHKPGPGVGGHCLSVDPWFIVEKSPYARLINLSRIINDNMPMYVVKRVGEILEGIESPQVSVLGIAYKGNVDDTRESPATTVIRLMQQQGIRVRVYDPHVRNYEVELNSFEQALENSDLILILADHDEFKYLAPEELGRLVRHKIVLDTKNCLKPEKWEQEGFNIEVLGRSKTTPE